MRSRAGAMVLLITFGSASVFADDSYVEPGALRLSHELRFENVMHRVSSGWGVTNNDLDKTYAKSDTANNPWKAEWGESLLTEAAARFTPDIFGRVLFEAQGDYADRFWRPINYNHHLDNQDRYVFLRQAEARIDRDDWYAHAFKGVAHGDWMDKGDFFGLYPESIPDQDYLGYSGYYGVYPENFKQDYFLNISRRHAPRGFEAGGEWMGIEAGAAFGNELQFGYGKSGYGRLSAPIGPTKLTFVMKDENVPYSENEDERDQAYALSLLADSSENARRLQVGVLYRPFRVGRDYQVADEVDGGAGLLGSSTDISTKEAKKSDAFAERLRYEHRTNLFDHDVDWAVDLEHAEVLAGNKNQLDLQAATDFWPEFYANIKYTYRKPLEGPVPFLYEGTPSNMGAIASTPRGEESPFWVNWDNREAVFLVTTLVFDPTPGSTLFVFKPDRLESWNVNPREDSKLSVAFQHRLSDYRTATDHLYYINEEGNYVFEPAAHSGAWASDHPLNEFKLMLMSSAHTVKWMLGFAGGQSVPYQSLAYTTDTSHNKPITDYYSIEGRLDRWPFVLWGHYGSGVWGPEQFQFDFGEAFDRLWGLGLTYKITVNTTVDVSYLGARQDDDLFVAPTLGSYDEIRTVFSHRFGFLFQFSDAVKSGYRAR